jgi:hypothetical protein
MEYAVHVLCRDTFPRVPEFGLNGCVGESRVRMGGRCGSKLGHRRMGRRGKANGTSKH